MYSYNTFFSLNLNGFSPYELVFKRKSKSLIDLQTDTNTRVLETFREYYELLTKILEHLQKL